MVSIHSLRLVYTFLYTIINGNVIVSFAQKKILRFCGPKKVFCVRSQPGNHLPLYAIVHIWLDPSSPPLCVLAMSMTPNKAASTSPTEIQFIHECCKGQKMCVKVVDNCPFEFEFVPD